VKSQKSSMVSALISAQSHLRMSGRRQQWGTYGVMGDLASKSLATHDVHAHVWLHGIDDHCRLRCRPPAARRFEDGVVGGHRCHEDGRWEQPGWTTPAD
jgi:hypothetical protein